MTKAKGVLGRGLASILGGNNSQKTSHINMDNTTEEKNEIGNHHEIPISQIKANPFQPRTKFDQEKLNELAISIEQLGIIQPITIRKMKANEYQLISGERRLRAAQITGLERIPAFIRIANDKEMLEMALVENIQRENLNAIEVALSYRRLIEEVKLTQEECSERVGKKRSTVTNFLRLLKLPEIIQKGLSNSTITNGHARSLLSIKSEESQINLFHDIVTNGYSVREVEQLAKEFANTPYTRMSKIQKLPIQPPFIQQKMTHDLSKKLDIRIELKCNKRGKGKLIIPFNDDTDFEEIIRILNN
tara:strand:- start:15796 stop:16707 length:912 start_codon:yes stop_codon:yes gene_type:complete